MQAVLAQLDRPLLCSSIRAADQMSGELPEPVSLFDQFQPKGLDFVVDDGRRVSPALPCVSCISFEHRLHAVLDTSVLGKSHAQHQMLCAGFLTNDD